MKVIFLAAGKSKRIYKKIGKNKCLLEIEKKTLIERSIDEIYKTNIKDITIVLGFKHHLIKKKLKKFKNLKFIVNKKYNTREMLYSLIFALRRYNSDIIFIYTDIIFSHKTINKILKIKKKYITIPVLNNWKKIWKIRNKDPYLDAEDLEVNNLSLIKSIGKKITNIKKVKHQFMGITYIPKSKRKNFLSYYNNLKEKNKLHLTSFLHQLVKKKNKIFCIKTNDKWYEFDDYSDFLNYKKYYKKKG